MRRAWLLLLLVGAVAGAAERHALLIGVSSVPALPRSAWLEGPRHDVPAMRAALLAQGFAPEHVVTLADGVAGAAAPSRAAILAQLARAGATLQAGDVLVLYWSGHGLLMPGPAGLWQTPAGQQVRLLAGDARIDPVTRQLAGTVGSNDIGRAIDTLAARGVQVVALFDSCYAAGGTRGEAGLVWRGMASEARAPALHSARQPSQAGPAPGARPLFVGFYAAEPQQRSAEALASDYPGQARGIFTRAMVAGLQDQPASYMAWAAAANQYYRQALDAQQLPASARPSPVYAGALDQPLWRAANAALVWPVQRDARGWLLPYGRLDGLRVGDRLVRGGAVWQVAAVNWGEARLDAAAGSEPVDGWASRIAAPQDPVVTGAGAGAVNVLLPGRSALRLRVPGAELARLRTRAASLAQVLALPPTAAAPPLLQARIEIARPGRPAVSLPFTDRDLGDLPAGTRLHVLVDNASASSVDLGIVHLPLRGPATRVFPPFEGDSNRMPAQALPFERDFELTAHGAGDAPEWLVLVAAPAASGAMPRRFALFDALRDASADRGAALASGRNADQAQVARISWRVVGRTP
ncbi:caspase family protein [Massilia sp. S19_KUP03_FR1]|uniref:caspase family protein n=1 Tax=Massilia sp. S19_KUP03_FR1 TaxID=3025503 RepID=UPI002FCD972B